MKKFLIILALILIIFVNAIAFADLSLNNAKREEILRNLPYNGNVELFNLNEVQRAELIKVIDQAHAEIKRLTTEVPVFVGVKVHLNVALFDAGNGIPAMWCHHFITDKSHYYTNQRNFIVYFDGDQLVYLNHTSPSEKSRGSKYTFATIRQVGEHTNLIHIANIKSKVHGILGGVDYYDFIEGRIVYNPDIAWHRLHVLPTDPLFNSDSEENISFSLALRGLSDLEYDISGNSDALMEAYLKGEGDNTEKYLYFKSRKLVDKALFTSDIAKVNAQPIVVAPPYDYDSGIGKWGTGYQVVNALNKMTSVNHLYIEEAIELNKYGLFNGKSNQVFMPALEDPTTAPEAITLIGKALKWPVDIKATSSFSDVPNWAVPYVEYAKANNITSGVSDNLFGSAQIDGKRMLTWFLAALGEDKGAVWDNIDAYSQKYNIIIPSQSLRNHLVYIIHRGIQHPVVGEDTPLINTLKPQN